MVDCACNCAVNKIHVITAIIMSMITNEPPVAEWRALAKKNRAEIGSAVEREIFAGINPGILNAFRRDVRSLARQFTQHELESETAECVDDALIIASGHQPVIYHPGLMRKAETLSDAARSIEACALNIIIDTDAGEGGSLSFPRCGGGGVPEIGGAQIAEGGALYFSQRIKAAGAIREEFRIVRASLGALSGYSPEARASVARAEEAYAAAAGKQVVIANTLVRRLFGGAQGVCEVPLTKVISHPFARSFYARTILSGVEFSAKFNDLLNQFRLKRKIKNHANPFPNLERSDSRIELPFWVIDRERGTRAALFILNKQQTLFSEFGELCPLSAADGLFDWNIQERFRLAPRAFMITALFRLFVCDLFVHGLGGGKYDAFLDDFIVAYWGIAAPAFAVVSETRSFFPEKVAELDRKLEVLSKSREIQFHLGTYLDNGTFPDDLSTALRHLWTERLQRVAELKEIKGRGESAFEVTQQLKKVDGDIKASLQSFFASIEVPAEEVQRVLRFREFPFFFFPS